MQRRLLRLVDDRTQMLAAISHGLRSALTRLRIAAEDCEGEPEQQAIVREIENIQAMVESTLTCANGEARMTPSRNTDVAALLISPVKHGGGARVHLADEDGRLQLHIEEAGPGIPPDHVEDAFAPFRRLDPVRSNDVRVSGWARRSRDVVRSHRETIALGTAPGMGLVVVVRPPLPHSPAHAHPAAAGREKER